MIQHITLRFADRDDITIPAHTLRGLAVHPALGAAPTPYWCVTHAASGEQIVLCASARDARLARLELLRSGVDWRKSAPLLRRTKKAWDATLRVQRTYGAPIP